LSTSPAIQAERAPSWKQEVNLRLAAHRNHKGAAQAAPQASETQHIASQRAAEAAARVAARFAKAPTYSEVLADEARAAVRAAEAVSQAALHAQAAAESILASLEAGLEVAKAAAPAPPEPILQPSLPDASQELSAPQSQSFSIQWEPDMPVRAPKPEATRATHRVHISETQIEDWRSPAPESLSAENIEMVEPAQPIHANLIEFPRELVATRKVRPHLAEGPYAVTAEPGGQLSIFEVDPGSISIEPAAAGNLSEAVVPVWPVPEWSGIQLDEQPVEELLEVPETRARAAQALELASASRRLMATVVDGSLVAGAFLGAAMVAASNVKELPALRVLELAAAVSLVGIGALYSVLFYVLATATPGMKYARIELCTFSGKRPTRGQRCGRLAALLLSLLPVGLGVLWSLFDEDRLSWHDRLTRTYLRKN
jgi:uncharacterized RDD family membrane protein YckC